MASPAVLDATVFSNLASTDGLRLVNATLSDPVTTRVVVRELERGREEGYTFLGSALEAIDRSVPVVDLPSPVPETFASALDPGEAAVLHLARTEDGTAVTDDGDARELAREHGVPVTGSLGVLARGVVTEELDVEEADNWLSTWRAEYGYRSPVDSISEVLPE